MTSARLTIGMACYDDFDGVYFSVQTLRAMHAEVMDQVRILAIDNHPDSEHGRAVADFLRWVPNGQYVPYSAWTGTAVRTLLFEELSSTPLTLCMDAHVLLMPGALRALLDFFEANPDCADLIQGPLLYDNLRMV